jgi:hypothetical protein
MPVWREDAIKKMQQTRFCEEQGSFGAREQRFLEKRGRRAPDYTRK